MSELSDMAAERRRRVTDAKQLAPRDALLLALEAIDSGEIAPTAVIVVHYDDKATGFFRAGAANNVVSTGMLHRAVQLIWRLK